MKLFLLATMIVLKGSNSDGNVGYPVKVLTCENRVLANIYADSRYLVQMANPVYVGKGEVHFYTPSKCVVLDYQGSK